MRMIEITKEKFDDFVNNSPYNNYCQTSNYGMVMAETGFDYNFIAYTTNDYEILAAGMFLTKKIEKKYYYAYCPRGFIIDYNDDELVKKFTRNLIKFYKRKKVVFLKINPEVEIANIDIDNNFDRTTNENTKILENLKALGFKKRKELYPLELLEPKLTGLIDLKNYNINNLDENVQKSITMTGNNGLELISEDASKIDILYDFIKDKSDKNINFYRNFYNSFKNSNLAELLLVKINFETFLINSKKKVEEEQVRNDELNQRLQNDVSEDILTEKMSSDKILEEYKQNVIIATEGMKKKEGTYAAGAIIIKFNKKITIYVMGVNKDYSYLKPDYFLYHNIFEKYKEDYDIVDINAIADDFVSESEYAKNNKIKLDFKPKIVEYIGELDLIVNEWKFKSIERNNLLSNEFIKKKDTSN